MARKTTIELLGHDAMMDALIDGTLTNFIDDSVVLIGDSAFAAKANLTKVDLGNCKKLDRCAFMSCPMLETVVLRSEEACFIGASCFLGTPLTSGACYIYVPRALLATYETQAYASAYLFRALEDYTVDGTIHGELDESKI